MKHVGRAIYKKTCSFFDVKMTIPVYNSYIASYLDMDMSYLSFPFDCDYNSIQVNQAVIFFIIQIFDNDYFNPYKDFLKKKINEHQ